MGGIYKTDDYFVLRDVYDNAENQFYVYSASGNKIYLQTININHH